MAKGSLEKRLVLMLMLLLASWLLVIFITVFQQAKGRVTRQVEVEVRRLSTTLAVGPYPFLPDLVSSIGDKLGESLWISVYDKELLCVASTTTQRPDADDDLRIAFQTGSQVAGYVRQGNSEIYHIVTPLSGSNQAAIDGLLEVGASSGGINGSLFSSYQTSVIIFVLGFGMVSAFSLFVFRRQIVAPLRSLTAWTKAPGRDMPQAGTQEITDLADSLHDLIKKTTERTDDLQCANGKLKEKLESKEREIRKMKQDLEEAQFHLVRAGTLSALGEFAAGISHELNNPLGIIMGFSQVLLDEVDPEHPLYKNLKRIEVESSRCKKIVSDLLNFARPSEPHCAMVQIHEILDETLQLLSYRISVEQINIVKDYQASLPEVFVDADQVEQVLMNIMANAVQAMPEGGTITVATSVSELTRDDCRQLAASFMDFPAGLAGGEVVAGVSKRVLTRTDVYEPGDKTIEVDISDTGDGILKENLVKLFHPFFTTKKEGTGLGLSICWKLVEKQGGIIGVKSVEGEGTTFSIKIPLRKKEDGTNG